MELSKTSALKLTLISIFTALLCLIAVGLLGLSLKGYWEFDANKRFATERLAELRSEIETLESIVEQKKSEASQVEKLWIEYLGLTNEIAQTSAKCRETNRMYAEQMTKLARIKDDLASVDRELALTNSAIAAAKTEATRLKREIEISNGQKTALTGVEQALAHKRNEKLELEADLKAKQTEFATLQVNLERVRGALVPAQSNLSYFVERAKSEERVIVLRKETISDLESSIAALEVRKEALSKSVDEIDKALRLQSPKEKILMGRLAELAGQYIAETNRLAEIRLQIAKEVERSQADLDADALRKQQEADRRLSKAKEVLAAAEKKAADLVAEAKATVAEIERTSVADRRASQDAIKAKTEAEAALLVAERGKLSADAAKVESEKTKISLDKQIASLVVRKTQLEGDISVLEQRRMTAETKAEEANAQVSRLSSEVRSLHETSEALVRAIASRQTQIKSMAETLVSEERK